MDNKNKIDRIQMGLLEEIADLHGVPEGAYNIRANGQLAGRNTTANIDIVTKTDKPGIDIIIKPNTKNESVHIPVVLSQTGLTDLVYNDFCIGENCDVTIIAGCGIHNDHHKDSQHDGIHRFFLEEGAKVKYIEKHYGEGSGDGKRILNPVTEVYLKEGSNMEMETVQIKGVDSTIRTTKGVLENNTSLVILEKIMTHGNQTAKTSFNVELNGENSSTKVTSRSVATENSVQQFESHVEGNSKCFGHVECDAIIKDSAKVIAIPSIIANNVEANLVHEATIGKIAGEQLMKLMTLGLDEKQAEQEIINGFLK